MKKQKLDTAGSSVSNSSIRIIVDEEFIVMADFLDFLYEYYKPDNNGRFVGVKYQDACTSGHVTKPVLCKMLETFNDKLAHEEGYAYIPVSEEVFDLIVPVETLKMRKLL